MDGVVPKKALPMNHPKVSIIIPVYNRLDFFKETLDSIAAQTFQDFEVIVVDDGSDELIGPIISKFIEEQNIDLNFIHQKKSGPGAARNKGLKVAQSEFIALLDSDDLWYPEMLNHTVCYLNNHPKIHLVCAGWDMINEEGKKISGPFLPSGLQKKIDRDFLREIVFQGLFPTHSVLCRKECFDVCGGFNENLHAYEDWELWVRMAAFGFRISFLDFPGARWRVHSRTRRSDLEYKPENYINEIVRCIYSNKLIAEKCEDLKYHTETNLWLTQANYYFSKGRFDEGQSCVHKAIVSYKKAPSNENLIGYYDKKIDRYQGSQEFRNLFWNTMPSEIKKEYITRKMWDQLRRNRRNFMLLKFMFSLIKLLFINPKYVIHKLKHKRKNY